MSDEQIQESAELTAEETLVAEGPDPDTIRELAYQIWEQKGYPADSSEEDWLQAEQLLSAVKASAATA